MSTNLDQLTALQIENAKLNAQIARLTADQKNADRAYNDMREACKAMRQALENLQNSFIHTEGNSKGNQAKTDVIKFNPDVREALNNARQMFWTIDSRS